MPRKKKHHTGRTDAGHTRDVKVERIGKVTIYQRGEAYYLSYRQGGVTQRRRIDGNRATVHKVQNALDEGRLSPIAFTHTSPEKMVEGYLDAVANVPKLALRTQDRYRAVLARFTDYCRDARISAIDTFDLATVEDFVKWLRGRKRTRNGAAKGKRDSYKPGGVKFILSTCRTAARAGPPTCRSASSRAGPCRWNAYALPHAIMRRRKNEELALARLGRTEDQPCKSRGNDDAVIEPGAAAHNERVRPLVGNAGPNQGPPNQPRPCCRQTSRLGSLAEGT
jgi:hypothetical protein